MLLGHGPPTCAYYSRSTHRRAGNLGAAAFWLAGLRIDRSTAVYVNGST